MSDPRIAELSPERVSWTCPLGLRFFDVATGSFVLEGLQVTATPAARIGKVVTSQLTPSGVHAFHQLPGLPAVDPPDQRDPWDPPPRTQEYRFEVVDRLDRFLPCTFVLAAPFFGLESPEIAGSPPYADPRGIPLFSAASRTPPPGFLVVRADLREFSRAEPAGWAMIEARYVSGGRTLIARGMADRRGGIVAMFPLPEGPRRGFSGSPPGAAQPPEFTVDLAFFHDPFPPERLADYSRRLSQPAVTAFREGSPGLIIDRATVAVGIDTHLRTLELAPP